MEHLLLSSIQTLSFSLYLFFLSAYSEDREKCTSTHVAKMMAAEAND